VFLHGPHGLKKKDSPDIVSFDTKELDKKLQKVFTEVRKRDGSEYKPYNLWVMIASSVNRAMANVSVHQRH